MRKLLQWITNRSLPLTAIVAVVVFWSLVFQTCFGEEPSEPNSVTSIVWSSKTDLLIGRKEGLESYNLKTKETKVILGDNRYMVALSANYLGSYAGPVTRVVGITKTNIEGARDFYEIFNSSGQPLLWSVKDFEFAPLSAIAMSNDGRLAISILEKLQSRILVFDHDDSGVVEQCASSEFFSGQPSQLFWESDGSLVALFADCRTISFEDNLRKMTSFNQHSFSIKPEGGELLDFGFLPADKQLKFQGASWEYSHGLTPHHFAARGQWASFLLGERAKVYRGDKLSLWINFGEKEEVSASAFSGDGEFFAVGTKSGKVRVLKTQPGFDGQDVLRKE